MCAPGSKKKRVRADLNDKAVTGDLQSPTLSQVGRALAFQLIASCRWRLLLGDIKGAFLAAGAGSLDV